MVRVFVTENYLTGLKRLHERAPELDDEVRKRIFWFVKRPSDERLENHPLTGEMAGLWSFSVTDDIRIVYLWIDKHRVRFLTIGSHTEVYK